MKLCRSLSRMIIGVAVLVLLLSLLPRADAGQQSPQARPEATRQTSQAEVRKLEIGKPIERELKGGENHIYEIVLEANQFLSLFVEQKGIDVVVTVTAADGRRLMEVDSPNGSQGPEPVTLVAEASGNYKFNIGSLEANAPAGRYEIKATELRAATERDINLAEAAKLNKEVDLLTAS